LQRFELFLETIVLEGAFLQSVDFGLELLDQLVLLVVLRS
jgi:hypothetical protein